MLLLYAENKSWDTFKRCAEVLATACKDWGAEVNLKKTEWMEVTNDKHDDVIQKDANNKKIDATAAEERDGMGLYSKKYLVAR